jgi:hypothetical protein
MEQNERFGSMVDEKLIPVTVKERLMRRSKNLNYSSINTAGVGKAPVTTGWITGEALPSDPVLLEKKALKANRNKLVYSGLSF